MPSEYEILKAWECSYDDYAGIATLKYGKPPKVEPKFRVGDRVRLKSGTAEIEVTRVETFHPQYYAYPVYYLYGDYVNSDNKVNRRSEDDFVLFDGESKMTSTNKLYTWHHDVDLYGHYLATNSQGEWVMEVKGSGQIMAVAKDRVQEVLPYTIGVQFGDSKTTYHYLADKDKFDVGFYLVRSDLNNNWQIAKVTSVDTKSAKATKEFSDIAIGKMAIDLL